jgi:hypothetical protein
MSYSNHTVVVGTLKGAPEKPNIFNDYEGYQSWQKRWFKVYHLSGYWKIKAVENYAAQRNLEIEKVELVAFDNSGKGRGGVDRRWFNINGVMQAIQC